MRIRNNSQLDFEVKIQYKNQIKARNLAPNGFLCLNDFYKGHENPENKIREYRVEIYSEGNKIATYSKIPPEVWIGLLGSKTPYVAPSTSAHLEGGALQRHKDKIDSMSNELRLGVPCTQIQMDYVNELIKNHSRQVDMKNMGAQAVANLLTCYYRSTLLEHMTLSQLWYAIKKIKNEDVEMTSYYYHEMINWMKRDFIKPNSDRSQFYIEATRPERSVSKLESDAIALDSETTQFDNEGAQPVAKRFKLARRVLKLVRNVFNQIRRS